jgi:hypothetical protein
LEIRLNLPIMIKKSGHIDDQVSNYAKEREGFNQGRFSQKVFDMSPAGQDISAIDSRGTGATHGSSTGVTESECPVLLILNAQKSFQKIHPLPDLHLKGFDPPGRIFLHVKASNSQCQKIRFHPEGHPFPSPLMGEGGGGVIKEF